MTAKNYHEILDKIYSLDKYGSKLGLERIERILFAAGNPQNSYRCIIVGGSNGKGSTVEMIASILIAAGLKTGSYFSPQVVEFRERIRINGKYVSKRDVIWAYKKVSSICEKEGIEATFFEVVTAMAFLIFQRHKVEYAVLEVGLGGRLDATNAAEPEIAAISSLSLEHTQILGPTIRHIAHEKCGIARKNVKLVCGMMNEEAKQAIYEECRVIGAQPLMVEDEVKIFDIRQEKMKYAFRAKYDGEEYDIRLGAPGRFQMGNACVALVVCKNLGIKKEAIQEGLLEARPRYRLEQVGKNPTVIADSCHNPEAAFALSAEVERLPARKKILVFSAMKDKDFEQMLKIFRAHFDVIVLCKVSLERAAPIKDLQNAAKKAGITLLDSPSKMGTEGTFAITVEDPHEAVKAAKKLAGKSGYVFIAGSIYLLAQLYSKDKIRIAQ
ncbi:MAG: bifunctional folylpolyglutamate synthase/dihydrofolate synthase [Candidatus Micrarchaeota archaeon]|nr:bifunctional folylpolyglutamate synthase/dihydrofolate synthase [Candidatus Micrarchaeota archaeon]